ncbi:MAG: hypothetical protein IJT88_00970 [Kiritimatiellae bacterium]|nr:hypothetical protein [Kiritimatiellia bacterium]MBQ9343767.1 hypothetical protein [Kiritimatiellia bacterium]
MPRRCPVIEYNDLFYVCSLVEYIGRERKLRRSEVVAGLGEETLRRIYRHADVFHCEPIAKVAADFIELRSLPEGDFDNVAACRYAVPSYWDIGAVHARLIEDVADGADPVAKLVEVYSSWMSDALSRFNSDLYYQPRAYLAECYRAGTILVA